MAGADVAINVGLLQNSGMGNSVGRIKRRAASSLAATTPEKGKPFRLMG